MAARSLATCIFCKIVKGEIPCFKLAETEHSLAFLDVNPLTKGHSLVIPKDHAMKMHELPDAYLVDMLPIAKKIALAQGFDNYNILQNNGRIAHQQVDHVHFHIIPKPSAGDEEGLVLGWPLTTAKKDGVEPYYNELVAKGANKL